MEKGAGFYVGEEVRILPRCDHPAHGQIGTVTKVIGQGKDKMPLLQIRLDIGYDPDGELPEIRYNTVASPLIVCQNEEPARKYVIKKCSVCGKNCSSNQPGTVKIAQDIAGKVICESCAKTHYYDRVIEKITPFT